MVLPINQIVQGDCLEVMREWPDGCVDAVVTDPPYGIDFQSARRIESQRFAKIAGDTDVPLEWLAEAYRVMRDGAAFLAFTRWDVAERLRGGIEAAGLVLRSQVIWDRDWHGLGDLRAEFAPQHDIVWFATKGAFRFPAFRPKSVCRFRRIAAEHLLHPNQKPDALLQYLVRAITPPGGIVLDPFCGSGTTCVAAKRERFDYVGIELSEEYCEIARRRVAHTERSLF